MRAQGLFPDSLADSMAADINVTERHGNDWLQTNAPTYHQSPIKIEGERP